jgi:hypothetical protein
MAELAEQLIAAWQQAAGDLGFRFTSPIYLVTPDQRRASYLGLVHEFGRRKGTLLRILQLGEMTGTEVFDDDHLVVKLGTRHATYERWLFAQTLRDWGWRGPAERRPAWLG